MNSMARITASLIALIAIMPMLAELSYAGDALKLPSTPVMIEVCDGAESHFSTLMSNVPQGYDVSNGRYFGWCVDKRYLLARSPVVHEVVLHSSLSPSVMGNESWDMVNFILNHKQGTAEEVQEAIWYFVNLNEVFTPSTNSSWAMINEALVNGEGFVPSRQQVVAVICRPTQPNEQVSIIEVGGVSDLGYAFSNVLLPFVLATPLILIIYTSIRKKKNKENNHARSPAPRLT